MLIELVLLSNHLILCHTHLLLPSVFPSIRIFANESSLRIRWPKYWSFNFSISPSMSIRGWFPLELTSLISIQSKRLSRVFSSTTVWKHQFLDTQPSLWSNLHMSMTIGQTIALTISTFVSKVITLVFNMLAILNACKVCHSFPSEDQAAFNFMAVVMKRKKAQEKKICHCFYFFSYLPWNDGTGCCDLSFLNVEI